MTIVASPSEQEYDSSSGLSIKLFQAVRLIQQGELVAFPTETVYGLGADATNPDAVAKIFKAKGRPTDNPLIVHIASADMWATFARGIDSRALSLAERFWPGPLTIVLPRTDAVPDAVTAGLDTVGVRMPSHTLALALIRESRRPLAAPSANRSGRPSPTTAQAVLDDMGGIIPMILDGGPCSVGVESTVLDLSGVTPIVLRPGGVTVEALREYLPDLTVDPSTLSPLSDIQKAASPGMKYRHYAPHIPLTIVTGERQASILALQYDDAITKGETPLLLTTNEMAQALSPRRCITLGSHNDIERVSSQLFGALRGIDESGATVAFAESYPIEGAGLALMNRLLRAAGFNIVNSNYTS
ncbi:MAG: threonylcarbamoyl-AMP synthase [Oscillospiraceae bacterium]|jgi:L-threonylcarbamoyladenylate synthase|nr:threonylcarbamoyl-AMP synthase [Oscillospiraceae bacterium]